MIDFLPSLIFLIVKNSQRTDIIFDVFLISDFFQLQECNLKHFVFGRLLDIKKIDKIVGLEY